MLLPHRPPLSIAHKETIPSLKNPLALTIITQIYFGSQVVKVSRVILQLLRTLSLLQIPRNSLGNFMQLSLPVVFWVFLAPIRFRGFLTEVLAIGCLTGAYTTFGFDTSRVDLLTKNHPFGMIKIEEFQWLEFAWERTRKFNTILFV